ncbi:hypothetical protein OV079_10975 [Nannocystis pusilla]|uniref:Lipoprotein n=1 Tax=Nannocystis pusilla TaxID=889268 RepID=A0A9X3IX16_9BACT|nr:hypothetical protein [Nannocystis pusilla]MCY1006074.1 hypothetical protein [Nannocystis pusilla]
MSALRSSLGVLVSLIVPLSLLSSGCGGDGKTLADKLAEDPEKKMLEEAGYVKKEIKRPPAGLPRRPTRSSRPGTARTRRARSTCTSSTRRT